MAALTSSVPGAQAVTDLQGVEDPRAFVHAGHPHLLASFHVMQPDTRSWARRRQVRCHEMVPGRLPRAGETRAHAVEYGLPCIDAVALRQPAAFISVPGPHAMVQWWEAEAPLHSHMAALRLSAGLDMVDQAAVLRCPGLQGMVSGVEAVAPG